MLRNKRSIEWKVAPVLKPGEFIVHNSESDLTPKKLRSDFESVFFAKAEEFQLDDEALLTVHQALMAAFTDRTIEPIQEDFTHTALRFLDIFFPNKENFRQHIHAIFPFLFQ